MSWGGEIRTLHIDFANCDSQSETQEQETFEVRPIRGMFFKNVNIGDMLCTSIENFDLLNTNQDEL